MDPRIKAAIDQALEAWLKMRDTNPDYYWPRNSDTDQAWEDLDDAMSILDETAAEVG